MQGRRSPYRAGRLWLLALLALAYAAILHALPPLTEQAIWQGSLGIFLGLFICAHPAANAIDVLFFRRYAVQELTSAWSGWSWLGLNLLILGLGWWVIALGAIRLLGPALR